MNYAEVHHLKIERCVSDLGPMHTGPRLGAKLIVTVNHKEGKLVVRGRGDKVRFGTTCEGDINFYDEDQWVFRGKDISDTFYWYHKFELLTDRWEYHHGVVVSGDDVLADRMRERTGHAGWGASWYGDRGNDGILGKNVREPDSS